MDQNSVNTIKWFISVDITLNRKVLNLLAHHTITIIINLIIVIILHHHLID